MMKRFFLLIFLLITNQILFSQVEWNTNGVLGFTYKIDSNGLPTIDKITPGSPAFLAGLNKDDQILKLNDESLSGISIESLSEKLKGKIGTAFKLFVQHPDKNQEAVTVKKAGMLSASYKVFKYIIFFDENYHTICNPDQNCVWGDGCFNGFGYYVYSECEASVGEYVNGNIKEGLFYEMNNGRPYYYLGEWANKRYSGQGTLTYFSEKEKKDRIYTGSFYNGLPHGVGEIKELDGSLVYTGTFKNGLYEGYGRGLYYNKMEEGLWSKMIYWKPWPDGVPHYNPITESREYDALLRKVSIEDSIELVAAKKKLDEYFKTPNKVVNSNNNNSTTTNSSKLEIVAEAVTRLKKEKGWNVYESFDVGFSSYQKGDCFTGCSDHPRSIYMFIEQDIPQLSISKMFISVARKSNDIGNYDAAYLASHEVAWTQMQSHEGIAIFYINQITENITSGCSYIWDIQSGDQKRHFAKIIVFSK